MQLLRFARKENLWSSVMHSYAAIKYAWVIQKRSAKSTHVVGAKLAFTILTTKTSTVMTVRLAVIASLIRFMLLCVLFPRIVGLPERIPSDYVLE